MIEQIAYAPGQQFTARMCELIVSDEISVREELDGEHVTELSEFTNLDPVHVMRVDGNFVIVDGIHRYAADKLNKLLVTDCIFVGDGTADDARDYWELRNMRRRKNLNRDETREVLLRQMKRHKLGPAQVAKKMGLKATHVSRLLAEPEGEHGPRVRQVGRAYRSSAKPRSFIKYLNKEVNHIVTRYEAEFSEGFPKSHAREMLDVLRPIMRIAEQVREKTLV